MKLLWKVKLDSQPREMHNLLFAADAERVATARGEREVAIVAGISDDLPPGNYAIQQMGR